MAKVVVTQLLLKNHLDIPTDSIMGMFEHYLRDYCKFNDKFYKHNIDVLIGSLVICKALKIIY